MGNAAADRKLGFLCGITSPKQRFIAAIPGCLLMSWAASSTGFSGLSPQAARTVLRITALMMLLLVAVSLSPLASGFADKPSRGAGDVELYQAEIQRIAAGESYYQAASVELHERGYPTRSVFNWRTPLPMWLLGALPSEAIGRWIIGVLAAAALALSVLMLSRETNARVAWLGGLTMIGALLPCWLEQIYVMPVVWSGVLILLSICAYALGRPGWGVICGLAAVFVRELAGPYAVISLLLAMRERRLREVAAWLVGMAAYGIFYLWHARQAMALVLPTDHAHAAGWLQFGGAAFVISVAQMNMFLLLLPQWVTALLLPLAILGFAGWNTPTGLRAGMTACVFLTMFAFFGIAINQYWGALIAPLMCLGAAQAPTALVELFRRARLSQTEFAPATANV